MNKKILVLLLSLAFALVSCAADKDASVTKEPEKTALTTKEQIVSYGIGYSIGKSIKDESIDGIDLEIVNRGLGDAYTGLNPAVPEKEIQDALRTLRIEQMAKEEAKGSENLAAAEEFLKANAQKDGIKELEKGLQYKIINSGSGKSPSMDSEVIVHYRGSIINGNEFDSSYKRGTPATMSPQGLIPGFAQALMHMKEGDKWEIYIHPDLAYGLSAPPAIGPNSLLIFEVELLKVN